jgi:hypothetical protein
VGDPCAVFKLDPEAQALLLAARTRLWADRVLADPNASKADRWHARQALTRQALAPHTTAPRV